MTAVTRTRIRCRTKDCPAPFDEDWHQPWCRGIYGHRCFGGATHQHTVKRSQGGKTIDACLCAGMHDAVDNGTQYANKVLTFDDGEQIYRLWDVKTGEILIDRVIRASSDGSERDGQGDSFASVSEPSPDASSVRTEAPGRTTDAGRTSEDDPPNNRSEHLSQPLAITPPSISSSLKPNGLDLPDEFTFEDWTDLAGMVAGMNKNRQWWAGDLMLAGERFGERATQFWNDMGYRYESLANCIRVCRRFPRPLRNGKLAFSHHAVVYARDDADGLVWSLSGHHRPRFPRSRCRSCPATARGGSQ